MRAGTLDRRVLFERAVDTQDTTTGEQVRAWQVMLVVDARVEPLRGREFFAANAVQDDIDTKITARWFPTIGTVTAKDRASARGVIYNIVSVINVDMADRELQFMCKSGVNDG